MKIFFSILFALFTISTNHSAYAQSLLDKNFTGKYLETFENTKPKYEANYKNGKKEGLEIFWYESGQEDGLFQQWYDNGQKRAEAYFKAGLKNGIEISWDRDGNKISETLYENGQVVTPIRHLK